MTDTQELIERLTVLKEELEAGNVEIAIAWLTGAIKVLQREEKKVHYLTQTAK